MTFYIWKFVTCEGSPGLISGFWSLITQSWLKWKMIFKAGSTFSVLTLSPNRTAGEDKIAVYFHQTLYPPLDQEAYKRKKPPPKPLKWKLWNLLSFHKKNTGGAAHRSLERPKYLATSAHAKEPRSATQRQQGGYQQPIGNELRCPLPTQHVALMIFLFPATAMDL